MSITVKDQLQQTITLEQLPSKIVSLVPSQTELLHTLGLEEQVAGITKFCIHPPHLYRTKERIGGTKTVQINSVRKLKPDLIIANKEENDKEQIDTLRSVAPVWVSDVKTLDDALEMIKGVGDVTGKATEANELAENIRKAFDQLPKVNKPLRTAYLMWKSPYMAAAGDTFVSDILKQCGLQNIFEQRHRYPQTTAEELKQLDCELLILSSEPYPFKQKHADELQQHLPQTKIVLADGEMFSWYGSRLLQAAEYLKQFTQSLNSSIAQ